MEFFGNDDDPEEIIDDQNIENIFQKNSKNFFKKNKEIPEDPEEYDEAISIEKNNHSQTNKKTEKDKAVIQLNSIIKPIRKGVDNQKAQEYLKV